MNTDTISQIFKLDNVTVKEPKFLIGTDTYDENSCAYCLCRAVDDKIEVIMAKTMNNVVDFDKEVENLSKYFNATILKETD